LGAKGSAELIDARQSRPAAAAAALFPEAAQANPAIFYRDGRPVTVAEIYANLTQGHTGDGGAPAAPTQTGYLHFDTQARLAKLEQERRLTDLILGMGDSAQGGGIGALGGGLGGGGSSTRNLTGSLFSSEMLSLLSAARQSNQKS
jgi:hypothetical protein